MPATWYVLGFTSDDIVGSSQDERLGRACAEAWRLEGRPVAFELLQTAGTGDHFVYWYVSDSSALLLDRQHVDWRRFVVGTCDSAPPGSVPILTR